MPHDQTDPTPPRSLRAPASLLDRRLLALVKTLAAVLGLVGGAGVVLTGVVWADYLLHPGRVDNGLAAIDAYVMSFVGAASLGILLLTAAVVRAPCPRIVHWYALALGVWVVVSWHLTGYVVLEQCVGFVPGGEVVLVVPGVMVAGAVLALLRGLDSSA